MPVYEFSCPKCENLYEGTYQHSETKNWTDDTTITNCYYCGEAIKRSNIQISAPSAVFVRGSGDKYREFANNRKGVKPIRNGKVDMDAKIRESKAKYIDNPR